MKSVQEARYGLDETRQRMRTLTVVDLRPNLSPEKRAVVGRLHRNDCPSFRFSRPPRNAPSGSGPCKARRSSTPLLKHLALLVIFGFAASTAGHYVLGRTVEESPAPVDFSGTPATLAIKSFEGLKEGPDGNFRDRGNVR